MQRVPLGERNWVPLLACPAVLFFGLADRLGSRSVRPTFESKRQQLNAPAVGINSNQARKGALLDEPAVAPIVIGP